MIVISLISIITLSKKNQEKDRIILSKDISLKKVTDMYLISNKLSYFNFSKNPNIFNWNNEQTDIVKLTEFDLILFVSETNCMECVKYINSEIKSNLNLKIALMGRFSSRIIFNAIAKKLKINPNSCFYTIDDIFENAELLNNINSPFIFKAINSNLGNLILLPIKDVQYVQNQFFEKVNQKK